MKGRKEWGVCQLEEVAGTEAQRLRLGLLWDAISISE